MEKHYWVLWTYIANYSNVMVLEGTSPENVVERHFRGYSDDFRAKAKIYVFDSPPVLTRDMKIEPLG